MTTARPLSREHSASARSPQDFGSEPDPLPTSAPDLERWLAAARIGPVSAIEWQCSPEWLLGPRSVGDSMWFWVERGTGRGYVAHERFRVAEGDLIMIPRGAVHGVEQDRGVAMHLFAVHFHPWVYEGVNLLELLGFPVHVPGAPVLAEANRLLAREYALRSPGWQAAFRGLVWRVLLHIMRHHGSLFQARGAGGGELARLLPALVWIDRHLGDAELGVRDVAAQLHVSEVQLRKLFRRTLGASPVQYIRRRRIERACAHLVEREVSVEQAALASGFSDAPYFCRVFKALMGTTPGRYRRTERI